MKIFLIGVSILLILPTLLLLKRLYSKAWEFIPFDSYKVLQADLVEQPLVYLITYFFDVCIIQNIAT